MDLTISHPGLLAPWSCSYIPCTTDSCRERENPGITSTRSVICLHDELKPQFTIQVKAKTRTINPLRWHLAHVLTLKGP